MNDQMTPAFSRPMIVLAYTIAMMASYVALDLASRISAARGRAVHYWLLGGALAMGTGIWSMHFIAMLAMHLPIAMAFDPAITLGSLIIAITISGFALLTVSRATLTPRRLVFASIVMGLGISGMHYAGMAAMQITPDIRYNPPLVAASVLVAVTASWVALSLAFTLRSHSVADVLWKKLASATVMAAAIVGMHFTGVAAATFSANTVATSSMAHADAVWLGGAIAGFSALFLAATILVSSLDSRQLEAANEKILELAQTDALTGLANRRVFLERLKPAFAISKRTGTPFSVLYFDLDNFKEVNDTLGHPAGDAVLREVTARLRKVVRETDVLARFGGDEFAILKATAPTPMASGTLAAIIGKALAAPYTIAGTEVHVTASIGIASYTTDLKDPDDMLAQADLALYRAKADGRNCFRFHSADLDAKVHERVTIGEELRSALSRGELELHYQPIVDLGSRHIVALEALVRWRHPSRGLLAPGAFVPVAAATGTIVPLGRWAFEQGCRQFRQWQDQGIAPPVLAVNLSVAQFKGASRLPAEIAQSLDRNFIAAESVELELTESDLMEVTERHAHAFADLRGLGVRIAIDDFGTGFSSFNYLMRSPIHRVKISPDLLSGAGDDARKLSLMQSAVRIASELGATVVAEGVETDAQARLLLAAGCAQGQGYYLGPPLPARDTTELLANAALVPHAA